MIIVKISELDLQSKPIVLNNYKNRIVMTLNIFQIVKIAENLELNLKCSL